ncbi:MAG: rhodanese-like domain-containing protein [Candidatus Heimdallarchaeota archaeon]|nr:rhodanese-like domain-containing protein [Candidatus Heimdallarchaeota archaeon]
MRWKKITSKKPKEIPKWKMFKYFILYIPGSIKFFIVTKIFRIKLIENISVFEAKEKMDKGELVILDIRLQESRESGYIEGSIHIEANTIKKNLDLLPKDKIIAVMCWGGGLSRTVTRGLIKRGFNNTRNLEGGMVEWGNKIDEEMLKCIW